ncbi:DUF2834 domain-containing protein [Floridanema evergladense]|uniref:DUF2834 domain-containing protein n=1 Tax=Floridaenema evergladense BLCC-F167 TaxID=3153639 RepID=A0ABV4WF51_9CYAN
MIRKISFWLIWLGFIGYASFLAPPQQPGTFELIKNLSIGQFAGINPLIIAVFYIMGVWPMIYSCLLFFDGRGQKVKAWPFATASLGVGAFSLLPYLALREPNPEFTGSKDNFLKVLDSRWTAILLSLITVGLIAFGLIAGDWQNYIQQWQTSRFIHVMSLDFCLLCLLFPALLGDDMARRGMSNLAIFWAVSFLPLFGPLAYLCLRPTLLENQEKSSTKVLDSTV